jgi:hypothetical protein
MTFYVTRPGEIAGTGKLQLKNTTTAGETFMRLVYLDKNGNPTGWRRVFVDENGYLRVGSSDEQEPPPPPPPPPPHDPPLTLAWTDTDSMNSGICSFSNVDIGAAAVDRDVIVFAYGGFGATTGTLDNIDIGDTNATIDKAIEQDVGAEGVAVGIGHLRVPSGTTVNISPSFSATPENCGIVVYRMTGHPTGAPYETKADTDDPISLPVTVPAGGVVVAGDGVYRGGGTSNNLWTGVTGDVDSALSDNRYDFGAGSGSFDTAQQPLNISGTHAATPQAFTGVAVAW